MVNFRKNFLRVLTLILVAFVTVTFASMMARPVDADSEPTFSVVQGASIRDYTDQQNTYYGLRFETQVSASWLSNNTADKYSFGTLIFPTYRDDGTDNYATNFNADLDSSVNKENLDAIKFIHLNGDELIYQLNPIDFSYSAAITYSKDEVLKAIAGEKDSYAQAEIDEAELTLRRVYKREFTAVSYVERIVGDKVVETIYTANSYTDSMEKVAMRLVNDPVWGDIAKQYLPKAGDTVVTNVDGYVINGGNGAVQVNDLSQEVHTKDFDVSNLSNFVLGNKTLVQDTDYTINGSSLVLKPNVIEKYLGSYENLYAYDDQNNLTVVKILFAHEELTTAEQVKAAFDFGIRVLNKDYKANNKAYVLGNDINMSGITMENAVYPNVLKTYAKVGNEYVEQTSDATDIGFAGIFDGRGYVISNATIELATKQLDYPLPDGKTGYTPQERFGFFHTLKSGSVIKNIAFVNVTGLNSVGNNATFGLSGPLAFRSVATIENVYIDINSSTPLVRGAFGDFDGGSLKNVVINFPMPLGYDFSKDYPSITTNIKYAYSYGSLTSSGTGDSIPNIPYENVQVISTAPIYAETDADTDPIHDDTSNKSAVYYGENETKLFYKFSAFDTVHGEMEHTVQSTQGAHTEVEDVVTITGKTRVVNGVRRYDDNPSLVADEGNRENIAKLEATGFFRVVNNTLAWHSEKAVQTVNTLVEYDASAGEFLTSDFEEKVIEKVVVNYKGVEYVLTEENGGITPSIVDGSHKYKFNSLDANSENTFGIPYITKKVNSTNAFTMDVYTETTKYQYSNLIYWTMLISDATELKTALDTDYTTTMFNYGYYKMDADITVETGSTLGYTYKGIASNKINGVAWSSSSEFGFNGYFDGNGHTIDMNGTSVTYGLFGNFQWGGGTYVNKPTVKNLRILNWQGNGAPILANRASGHTYWGNDPFIHIENVYASWKGGIATGLVKYAGGTVMNNVLVKTLGTDADRYNLTKDYGDAYGKAYYNKQSYYKGGSLFTSLASLNKSMSTMTNIITVGKNPLAFQPVHNWWYRNATKHTLKEVTDDQGAVVSSYYEHSVALTGFSEDYNEYVAYAGNQTEGAVAIRLSLKESFLNTPGVDQLRNTYTQGAYCATCYNEFSLVTDGSATCSKCGVAMKVTGNTQDSDIWAQPAIYNWGVHNLTNFTDNLTSNGGYVKFEGVSQYKTLADMKSSGNKYESFIGADGNGMWRVSPEGELVWHTEKFTFTDSTEIDYDSKDNLLHTNKFENVVNSAGGIDKIESIEVAGKTLTVENGGIITENGYIIGLRALKESEDGDGVPFMNTFNSASNVLTLTVNTSGDTFVFNNVHYQTMVIDIVGELALALDMNYSTTTHNYGFYKLATDLLISETQNVANPLKFAYTGLSTSSSPGYFNKGFAGQFDGGGHTLDFNRCYMTNGLFGSFDIPWGYDAVKSQVSIHDLAIKRYKGNGHVLAYYGSPDGYNTKCALSLSNLYVHLHRDDMFKGLIYMGGQLATNNVVVDASNTASTAYLTNNIYGEDIVGKASLPSYDGGTLYGNLRRYASRLSGNIKNFISIGTAPIVWKAAYSTKTSGLYSSVVNHTKNADGVTYTHTIKNLGWTSPYITGEVYVGYAGNLEYGDIALRKGLKENFLKLVTENAGTSALPGVYCSKCYNQFDLDQTVTVCPDPECLGNMVTTVDLWSCDATFIWGRTKLEGFTGSSGEQVFPNVKKFDSTSILGQAYQQDSTLYDSFMGDAGKRNGKSLWAIQNNVLTWVGI